MRRMAVNYWSRNETELAFVKREPYFFLKSFASLLFSSLVSRIFLFHATSLHFRIPLCSAHLSVFHVSSSCFCISMSPTCPPPPCFCHACTGRPLPSLASSRPCPSPWRPPLLHDCSHAHAHTRTRREIGVCCSRYDANI